MMCKLSVVVPCYNEEDNIKRFEDELIGELVQLGMPFEIVAVDDGSTDATLELLVGMAERFDNFRVVSHKENSGLGAAIRTGIGAAKGEWLVTIDADLTFHPKQIKLLVERMKCQDVDCVIGDPKANGYSKDIPFYRIAISNIGSLIYRLAIGRNVSSVTPIFRLYKTEQLTKLALSTTGFGINAEILSKLIIDKRATAEIPVVLTNRQFGYSKLDNIKEMRRQLYLASKIVLWRLKAYLHKGESC